MVAALKRNKEAPRMPDDGPAVEIADLAARSHEYISTDCEEAEREITLLRANLDTAEAWMAHALSVMKDRRLPSRDQIEDGDAILGMIREALK